jgi:hypothetical protein
MELDCLKERQEFNYSKQLIHVPQINGGEMRKRKKKLRAQAQ